MTRLSPTPIGLLMSEAARRPPPILVGGDLGSRRADPRCRTGREYSPLILDRQGVVDVEEEEWESSKNSSAGQLATLRYSVDHVRVFIPSGVAARGGSIGRPTKNGHLSAPPILTQWCREGKNGRLRINDGHTLGRGFIWVGDQSISPRQSTRTCRPDRQSSQMESRAKHRSDDKSATDEQFPKSYEVVSGLR